jgi:hypothetical protein
MVVLSLGCGLVLADRHVLGLTQGSIVLVCLGLGFVGIYFLGLILGMRRHWWPLVPGAALTVLAGGEPLLRLAVVPPAIVAVVQTWWPVALIVVGAFFLFRALR